VVELYLDTIRRNLKFDGYPIPKKGFAKPGDFWVETDASGIPLNGPDARGLSQIINRNFVSEGTNFMAFLDGDHHPEYPDPILKTADCYEELIDTQDAEERPIRGLVQFCRNSFRDPNTGIVETNPRMTTFSLFGRDLKELGFVVPQGFSLNALNAVSIGELTIPRAVGYSAALLDYFFRGRLDVALVEGAGGTSELEVTNRGEDPLGAGTLTLYSEDTNGLRQPVTGATITRTGADPPVPQHGQVPPLSITLPPGDPERFVAVFQGTLGQEQGAVVGQVVDSRLEQLLEITGGWVLRTADRVYWLPFEEFLPETQHFVLEVKWGARDTTLGVWSIMSSDEQIFEDAFTVFELTRPPGTQGIETTGALRDGLPVAKLTRVGTVPLSALHGLPLGTTVTLEHTHRHEQHRVEYTVTQTFVWNESKQTYIGPEFTTSHTVVPDTSFAETYAQTFALILDDPLTSPRCRPLGEEGIFCDFYEWGWEDFTVSDGGDILLFITLQQGLLPDASRQVQGHERAPNGILVPVPVAAVTFSFPLVDYEERVRGPLLGDLPFLAWVNLSERALLAKSTTDGVRIAHETTDHGLRFQRESVIERIGGPAAGREKPTWGPEIISPCSASEETCAAAATGAITPLAVARGLEALTLAGWYGAPFAALGLDQFTLSGTPRNSYWILDPNNVVKVTTTHGRLAVFPWRPAETPDVFFASARRGDQAVAGLPIVFGRPSPDFTGLGPDPEGRLVLWDGRPRGLARSLLQTATPLFEPLANQRWALAGSFDQTGPIAYLMAVDGSATFAVPVEHLPDVFFSDGFTLLEPSALYNALEGKFYAIGPSLRRMVLPLKPLQAVDPSLDPLYVDGAWWPYQIVGPR
jgi:hypothetical protein